MRLLNRSVAIAELMNIWVGVIFRLIFKYISKSMKHSKEDVLTEEQIAEFQEAFSLFDMDGDVLYNEEEIFTTSDEKYAEELQLQEALLFSASYSRTPVGNQYPQAEKHVETQKGREKLKGKEKATGQSSDRLCLICMDVKPNGEMFRNSGCSHLFCTDCIRRYVGTKIQENISRVKCPDVKCEGVLEPQSCRSIIPQGVFDRWENALCESSFLGSQKFYCPFKDCSAMLVDDGGEVVTSSECPNCWRLFCAQCRVPWHAGIECREFQKLSMDEREREDIMMMELAKQMQWRRCPRCKFIVEKGSGCLHITCRCGFEFCYGCGSNWTETHGCSLS